MESKDRERKEPPRRADGKRPYAPPTLTEYGDVAKLTQSGAGSVLDGSPNRKNRTGTCL